MSHIPAGKVNGPLDAVGRRVGADDGDPQVRALAAAMTAGKAGVWECEPGGWPVVDRTDTEICYVLSGTATICEEGSSDSIALETGDLLILPRGWTGRWDVTTTLRKIYVIF